MISNKAITAMNTSFVHLYITNTTLFKNFLTLLQFFL